MEGRRGAKGVGQRGGGINPEESIGEEERGQIHGKARGSPMH